MKIENRGVSWELTLACCEYSMIITYEIQLEILSVLKSVDFAGHWQGFLSPLTENKLKRSLKELQWRIYLN